VLSIENTERQTQKPAEVLSVSLFDSCSSQTSLSSQTPCNTERISQHVNANRLVDVYVERRGRGGDGGGERRRRRQVRYALEDVLPLLRQHAQLVFGWLVSEAFELASLVFRCENEQTQMKTENLLIRCLFTSTVSLICLKRQTH
jgi:hypothetical protein